MSCDWDVIDIQKSAVWKSRLHDNDVHLYEKEGHECSCKVSINYNKTDITDKVNYKHSMLNHTYNKC